MDWENYELPQEEFLSISGMIEITGCDSELLYKLIDDNFFGDLYADGFFEYYAVGVLNDYLEDL